MKKELIFAIIRLVVITGIFFSVAFYMQNAINNTSSEQLQNVNPYNGIRAVGVLIGSVLVGAFIYSFWWYPKKCIEYETKTLKENKEHMERMENL